MEYIVSIEEELSRLAGRPMFLRPLDWHLAAEWERQGVPINIVLRTMAEVHRKFKDSNPHGEIFTLKYFKNAVENAVADWQASQVGKSVGTDSIGAAENSETGSLADHLVGLADRLLEYCDEHGSVPGALLIEKALRAMASQNSLNETEVEEQLQSLDRHFISALLESLEPAARASCESAGTSTDPYLKSLQIAAAVRRRFNAPEISLEIE